MSHYYALVVIPAEGDVEEHLNRLLDPHEEEWDDDANEFTGFWNWWQIGGRWTGALTDYKPAEDPENWETCRLCHGTGKRDDPLGRQARLADPAYTCNGCAGKGWHVTWPLGFAQHDGDLQRLGSILPLREGHQPYTLVLPDGQALHRSIDFSVLDTLNPDLRIVVVDYHS